MADGYYAVSSERRRRKLIGHSNTVKCIVVSSSSRWLDEAGRWKSDPTGESVSDDDGDHQHQHRHHHHHDGDGTPAATTAESDGNDAHKHSADGRFHDGHKHDADGHCKDVNSSYWVVTGSIDGTIRAYGVSDLVPIKREGRDSPMYAHRYVIDFEIYSLPSSPFPSFFFSRGWREREREIGEGEE